MKWAATMQRQAWLLFALLGCGTVPEGVGPGATQAAADFWDPPRYQQKRPDGLYWPDSTYRAAAKIGVEDGRATITIVDKPGPICAAASAPTAAEAMERTRAYQVDEENRFGKACANEARKARVTNPKHFYADAPWSEGRLSFAASNVPKPKDPRTSAYLFSAKVTDQRGETSTLSGWAAARCREMVCDRAPRASPPYDPFEPPDPDNPYDPRNYP
jgi:hypothetical protein